jgi:hypothetical protein
VCASEQIVATASVGIGGQGEEYALLKPMKIRIHAVDQSGLLERAVIPKPRAFTSGPRDLA